MAKTSINLILSTGANFDIQTIHKAITEDYSKSRADKYVGDLFEKIEILRKHPEAYPPCRNKKLFNAGLRCFTFKKRYLVVYEIEGLDIIILAVLNARMNPKRFELLV